MYISFQEYTECKNHDSGYGWYFITPRWIGLFVYLFKKITRQPVRIYWYKT